jgi:dipeptidyl aminopeptidase/acylaminoacyl peptidase
MSSHLDHGGSKEKNMFRFWIAIFMCAVSSSAWSSAPVDVAAYVKRDDFNSIKLSPNGDYYAASVPMEDKSVLVIIRRVDNKATATFNLGKNKYVYDFAWVNPQLVLLTMAEKIGALETPLPTGNLYSIGADGTGIDTLVGQDVEAMSTGTHIQVKKQEFVAAQLVDDLPADDDNVLISTTPFNSDAYSQIEKMDVHSGKRKTVVRAPVRNARFLTDHQGVVRFAHGVDMGNIGKLFYRAGNDAQWQEINDELANSHDEWPIGFSADDRIAYLQVEQPQGPDAIVAMDVASGNRTQVFRDDDSDPRFAIYDNGMDVVTGTPVGVGLMDGKPRTAFFDPATPDARLYRSLEAAFPGNAVYVTSKSTDGKLVLVEVDSDRNPGDFYVFDTVAKKADLLASRREWFDPEAMAQVRPITFAARDGMTLHGYVTLPLAAAGKHLPMVVFPHGGPIGVADTWSFNSEAQMLAAAGYAVLQVDFRGSGQHGRAYQQAGAREWGGKMQDDVTDATRWAITQGIADPQRICIFGGSYGAYAALMGVVREPALYQCAVGYVGVYDLPRKLSNAETPTDSGKASNRQWVGEAAQLVDRSPVNLAAQIKVPVFLAAGGQDKIAPIEHSERMEKALRAAGVPVETLYYRTEGHGFYVDEHRQAFYTQLLAFLGRNIGAPATTATH